MLSESSDISDIEMDLNDQVGYLFNSNILFYFFFLDYKTIEKYFSRTNRFK